MRTRPRSGHPRLARTAPGVLLLAIVAACSREPAPEVPPSSKPAAPAVAAPAAPPTAASPVAADRMDCMGAGGIRFALDFDAGQPRAFEYASSNPADRSMICRYLASEGDATSTWRRSTDGGIDVELKEGATSGPARFIFAPDAGGWRVQIVAEPKSGKCYNTPPPNLMVLAGRPGQECSLTAQGGIAAASNALAERQKSFCDAERFDVAVPPSQSQDPAAVFRELPAGIVGMTPERREAILAPGSDRVEQLDAGAGYLSVKRELRSFDHRADADGYIIGTYRDATGRTVAAIVTNGPTGVTQGLWRADAKGWSKVGCELIDDYRIDFQYMPLPGGKSLEVFDPNGQPAGRLAWNGERFVGA